MAYFSWLLVIGILFSFSTLEAQILTISSGPTGPTHVEMGANLTLNVTYNYTGTDGVRVSWFKGACRSSFALVKKAANGKITSSNNRAFIEGEASLLLTNTQPIDYGTYGVQMEADDVLNTVNSGNYVVFNHDQNLTIISSSPTGPTYVQKGETLRLNVTYNYTGSEGVRVAWYKDGSFTALIRKNADGGILRSNNSRSTINGEAKNLSIKGEASFVLTNTQLMDNGTYRVQLDADYAIRKITSRELVVIIQVRPTAVTECSPHLTVKEGDDFECLCNSTSGNPPPIASWYKDDSLVNRTGYLKKTLSLKNIKKEDNVTYVCRVESHDLKDEKTIEIQVQYKPIITSFKSDQDKNIVSFDVKTVKITCIANGLPKPNYNIIHNGTQLTGVVNGEKTITSENYDHAGSYECIANNSVGNGSDHFFMNMTAVGKGSVKSRGTFDTFHIVGIILGQLFLTIIIIFLIWWRCCRGTKKDKEHDDSDKDPVKRNPHDASDSGMLSEYAKVDKKKTKKATQPPVRYATLDADDVQPDSSKKHKDVQETEYASIELEKLDKDLV